jgi:hypothetical protein
MEEKPRVDHDRANDRINEMRFDWLEENIKEINETLYNDGKGIVYDVRQLKHDRNSSAGRFTSVINVLSIVISFIVMLLMIIEKL